jgi:cystathionine beta-lyase/cystathionine gamma-synthase
MRLGGTVIAVEIDGDFEKCQELVSLLHVVRIATSFGGPETLVCHPATSTHVGLSQEALTTMGVTDGLLRFSIGLEDADDLVDDIHRALVAI